MDRLLNQDIDTVVPGPPVRRPVRFYAMLGIEPKTLSIPDEAKCSSTELQSQPQE